MPETIHVQVIIPHDSNVPRDAITNSFHFDWDGEGTPDTGEIGECFDRLVNAYNPVSGQGPGDFISQAYQQGNATMKAYLLSDPAPRTPRATATGVNLGSGSGAAPLPEEVALVLSYHANIISGDIAARRRGRTYFGPFTVSALNLDVGNVIPDAALVTALLNFGNNLHDANTASLGWAVHSSVGAGETHRVEGGWVDNAFDTQRRRGRRASARTTF